MNHIRLARAAQLAYPSTCNRVETMTEMQRLFPGTPWSIRFIILNRTDTELFMVRSGSTIVIAVAGTESLWDLWTDFRFVPGAYYLENEQMCVHQGFAKVINEVKLTLVSNFRSLFQGDLTAMSKITDVIITGHSLGAAVGLGAMDILWYAFPEIRGKTLAVTFGCPNGWSRSAREAWESRHRGVNYVNPWDYVTHMLGFMTGRPGQDIKLEGMAGHFMDKYIANLGVLK